MPSSERHLVDAKFSKLFVTACVVTPLIVLGVDAWRGALGVNAVNYVIRTTGLLGLVFLVTSLAITPLRRLTGWGPLVAVRRNFGVAGAGYIFGHFLIFFVYDRALSITSTLEEIVERVYLWFGVASLLILIPLAITSTDRMLTRLGPKRWRRLHKLTYVAIAFGVVHFYLLVKADTTTPLVFAGVLGGLLAYRVVAWLVPPKRPVREPRNFFSGELEVAQIRQETHDVKTFRFVRPGGGPLSFTHVAGQYLNVTLVAGDVKLVRSYTISSSASHQEYCEISVKRAPNGYGSHVLHDTVKVGDRLHVRAPAGRFVFAGHESERVVLVGGGVGITPMMSVVRTLTDRAWAGDIYLMFALRERRDIVFERELTALQVRFPNLHVRVTLDVAEDTWEGGRGRITREALRDFVPHLTRGPVLVCGPGPMMAATRALLIDLGVPDAEILQEVFASPPAATAVAVVLMGTADAVAEEPLAETATVRFGRSNVTVEVTPALTLLEAAEDAGVEIPFDCRSGVCGQCKTRLVSGRVRMDAEDALDAKVRAAGLVLACQARATRDCVVDA